MTKPNKTHIVSVVIIIGVYFVISLKDLFLKDAPHHSKPSVQACEPPFRDLFTDTADNLDYYIDLAKRSDAVYDNKAQPQIFLEHCDEECTININGGGVVQIKHALDNNTLYLVFKGTDNTHEVKVDVSQHLGFDSPYYNNTSKFVAQILVKYNPKNIVLAGHSLGGALALYVGLQWHNTDYSDVSVVAFNPAVLHQRAVISKIGALSGLTNNTFNFVIDGDIASNTVSATNAIKLQGHTFVLEPTDLSDNKHAIKTVIKTLEHYNKKMNRKVAVCEAYRGKTSIVNHKG